MLSMMTPRRRVVCGAVALVVICLSEGSPLCLAQGDRGGVSVVDSNPQRTASFVRVRARVLTEGSAPVIVVLDVPDAKSLLANSRRAKDPVSGRRADALLATAIDVVTQQELLKLAGAEYRVHRTYEVVPFIALQVSKEALDLLEASPAVLDIQEDHLSAPSLDTTIALIGADTTWDIGYDGSGWYVAVLDTGLRDTHEFFAGKDIVQACYARGQDGNTGVGDCPNGQSSDLSSPHPAQHHSTNPRSSHGTHVAGIAVGNGPGVPEAGVAKGAGLIAIQVFSQFFSDPSCAGGGDCVLSWSSDQISALGFLFQNRNTYNIASANMSLGGGDYADEASCDAANAATKVVIDNLRSVGIATVISSGNDGLCGSMGGPGCISTAVAVGATNDLDSEASFSNYDGAMLEIYAPGVSVLSSIFSTDSSYQSSGWSGTSMAAPHVAGAWAVLKQAAPEAGVQAIVDAIQSSAAPVSGRPNCNPTPPNGRIQLDAAFDALVPAVRTYGIGKLSAVETVAGDEFGVAVGVDGDVAVVGSRFTDCVGGGNQCGTAFIYRWDEASVTWSQEAQLDPPAPGGNAQDRFGTAVAVGGGIAGIGVPFDDHGVLTDAGSVSFFEWDGLSWDFSQQLIAPDAEFRDLYGISVAIDGTVAVVGASNEGNTGVFDGVGAAYFYSYDGASWGFVQKVTPAGGGASDAFGRTVSISGDVAVVSSMFADCAAGDGCGAVFVYRWDGATWVEEQTLQDAAAATFDTFGRSVSVRGDVIMVGASGVDCAAGVDCGAVYVYTWNGSTWVFEGKLTPDGSQENDWFGQSVAIGGGMGVAGAPGRDCDTGDQCGTAYGVRLGTSGWFVDGGPFVVPDLDVSDGFGDAVARDGYLTLVGARRHDPLGTGNTGAVYTLALDIDCNENRQADFGDIRNGISPDLDTDGVPDECFLAAALTDTLGPKNRYLSVKPRNAERRVAIRVEFLVLPDPHSAAVGRQMWLSSPDEITENAGKTDPADAPGDPTLWASALQCDPAYFDWDGIDTVYVYDAGILPGGQYSVQILEELFDAGVEENYTAPLVLDTSDDWGDIISNCAATPCGPPDGSIDVTTDVTAVLNKFKNIPGAPIKARSDLDQNVPDFMINISDVTHAMNAFGGFGYPFLGPPAVDPCL